MRSSGGCNAEVPYASDENKKRQAVVQWVLLYGIHGRMQEKDPSWAMIEMDKTT